MWLYFTVNLFIILTCTPIQGQQLVLTLDSLTLTTPCVKGLRSKIDKFVITGTAGRNYTALTKLGWDTHITLEILKLSASKFESYCHLLIGDGGVYCGESHTTTCRCDHIDPATGSALFVFSLPAEKDHGAGVVRAAWEHFSNKTVVYSQNKLKLPFVYDINDATLEATVNGDKTVKISSSCRIPFEAGRTNALEVCCRLTASPCYPTISLEDRVLAKGPERCVNYTFRQDHMNFYLVFSYSVCSLRDNVTAGTCAVGNLPVLTDNPTTETPPPSTVTTTTEPAPIDSSDIPFLLGLTLGIPLLCMVIIVLVVCCIWQVKKRKVASSTCPAQDNAEDGPTAVPDEKPCSPKNSKVTVENTEAVSDTQSLPKTVGLETTV